jgi:hypothetical protein
VRFRGGIKKQQAGWYKEEFTKIKDEFGTLEPKAIFDRLNNIEIIEDLPSGLCMDYLQNCFYVVPAISYKQAEKKLNDLIAEWGRQPYFQIIADRLLSKLTSYALRKEFPLSFKWKEIQEIYNVISKEVCTNEEIGAVEIVLFLEHTGAFTVESYDRNGFRLEAIKSEHFKTKKFHHPLGNEFWYDSDSEWLYRGIQNCKI